MARHQAAPVLEGGTVSSVLLGVPKALRRNCRAGDLFPLSLACSWEHPDMSFGHDLSHTSAEAWFSQPSTVPRGHALQSHHRCLLLRDTACPLTWMRACPTESCV